MKNSNDEYMDCGMLIKLISDHIQSSSNRKLQEVNLTVSQLRYLEYLDCSGGPVLFKDVENHFQTSQPTVSGIMRRLAEKGLIKIESAGSGRAKTALLTDEGKKILRDSGTERRNEEERILGALREDEREAFHDMLERINRELSE
jgi:MarR family transcriptional repressor of mepA